MLRLPGIVYGNVSTAVKVPICFRKVTSKIMQLCRIVVIQVKPRRCVPDRYDTKILRGLG